MIQTDEHGTEFKTCKRDACGKRFEQGRKRSNFLNQEYCSPQCRIKSNTQPAPAKRQVHEERSDGFTNPDGVWRPAGFPVWPGGIEPKGEVA